MTTQPTNLAIVIGVPNYDTLADLPACAVDALEMSTLLRATEKYTDILTISDGGNTASIRNRLRDFFGKHASLAQVEELFFYFSGHGVMSDDLLLCGKDYDKTRPKTTALQTVELDDLIRSVSPNLAVKVIDACESGRPYVKDTGNTPKALELSKNTLKNVRFIASCQGDQSSFIAEGSSLSDFTNQFIAACLQLDTTKVLYRDIESYIADSFEGNDSQSPYFVSQGTGLEVFSTHTESLQKLSEKRNHPDDDDRDPLDEDIIKGLSILDRVSQMDAGYVSADEVETVLAGISESLEALNPTDALVSSLYKFSCSFSALESLECNKSVARIATKKHWAERFYIQCSSELVTKTVPKDPLGMLALMRPTREVDMTTIQVEEASRVIVTHPLAWDAITLEAQSEHPSLPPFALVIVMLPNRLGFMRLIGFPEYEDKGWNNLKAETLIAWQPSEATWKELTDDPGLLWQTPCQALEAKIVAYLNLTFGPSDPEPEP